MRTLITMAAVLWGTVASTQYWKALGRGTIGPTEVQTLFGDSASGRLLAGGTFLHIKNESDTVLAYGQAAWNGERWDSLATRVQQWGGGESVQQTFWFLRFQDRLYACGGFALLQANGEWTSAMARLDGQGMRWEGLGCNVPITSGIMTLVPKMPGATLYATGYRGYDDEFCGFPRSCVFRYDGTAFHAWPPFDEIPDDVNNYVGTIFDYQGKTYMTGSFRDPLGPGWATLLRYTGSAWEHVPGWNTLSPIKEILIRDGLLYVAGAFRYATGGPGNLVASFNGETWNDLGGGLAYTPVPMSGVALDLKWFQNELWACGLFNRAGGAPAHSIAKWDGQRWCVPPGDFRWIFNGLSRLSEMAVWRDSLYVCGGINTVDGDTMRQVVQWIGGDAVEACSQPVGIQDAPGAAAALQVVPMAAMGQWTVHLPNRGNWQVDAYSAAGQRVGHWRAQSTALPIDLSAQRAGLYLLRALSGDGKLLYAKLMMP